jgi:[ribosomal protein S18]-alanine N-acetyltransferase
MWVHHPSRSSLAGCAGTWQVHFTGFNSAFLPHMHYRLFEPADFDDLYAIEEVCFQHPQRFTRRYMRQLIVSPDSATWIAEQNDTVVGFAILEWSQQISGVLAYIATIEVLPAFRKQGIAAELLRRLEGSANAERAIAISLHVDTENDSAIRLYERLGYCNSGRAEHYYARHRPAAIYVKQLE